MPSPRREPALRSSQEAGVAGAEWGAGAGRALASWGRHGHQRPRPGRLKPRGLSSGHAGSRKCQLEASAVRAPPGASPRLVDAVVTWPFLCVCMCSNLLFLEGHRSNWTTAHASDLAYLIVSRYSPAQSYGGVRASACDFWGT